MVMRPYQIAVGLAEPGLLIALADACLYDAYRRDILLHDLVDPIKLSLEPGEERIRLPDA